MTEIALSSIPKLVMLPLPHTSPHSLFIFIYIFRHLGIFFLERNKKSLSLPSEHFGLCPRKDYSPQFLCFLAIISSDTQFPWQKIMFTLLRRPRLGWECWLALPWTPLPMPPLHFPGDKGHTGIWMHSSSTHALKDLSLLEFYLSGFWAVSPHCHLDHMSFSQSQMPFTYQAHFTFFRKVAAADGRRQLFAVHIIPVQSFRVEKGKPFRRHKQRQSLLSQWDFIVWIVLDLYFLQVNLQSGFSPLKFCLVTKIEMNTQSWRFYHNSLT